MRWHTTILTLAVLTALQTIAFCLDAGPKSPENPSGRSILVLLSGEVLQGEISRLDDKYVVSLDSGRIFVPENSVEVVCNDLREAYAYRRSQTPPDQARDHAELAQWCQRHGLEEQAEAELQVARQLDPKHPIIGLVERRLAAARLSHDPSCHAESDQSSTEPTPQQLDDFAAGLPSGTVEAFTRVIQPLLINRCATSGCHTERSQNEFRLERSRPGVPLGRTSTNRNLYATLRLVDAADPNDCELLQPKRCTHRLQTEAAFPLSRTGQYRALVTWVSLLTKHYEGRSGTAVASKPQTAIPDTVRTGPPQWEQTAAVASPAVATELYPADEAPVTDTSVTLPAAFNMSAPQHPAVDPFDPAVFNRRYGTSPPAGAGSSPETTVPPPSLFFSR